MMIGRNTSPNSVCTAPLDFYQRVPCFWGHAQFFFWLAPTWSLSSFIFLSMISSCDRVERRWLLSTVPHLMLLLRRTQTHSCHPSLIKTTSSPVFPPIAVPLQLSSPLPPSANRGVARILSGGECIFHYQLTRLINPDSLIIPLSFPNIFWPQGGVITPTSTPLSSPPPLSAGRA